MTISGSLGMSGMEQYRISSVHGNPSGINAIHKVNEDGNQKSKPLLIATKEKDDKELYVKDYGELKSIASTAIGGFADILEMQEQMTMTEDGDAAIQSVQSTDYWNDTIGMMGFQNQLRDQLMGTGFTPFA